jgi:glycosyltransferase involved in cell wall biosynthesis
VIALSVVVCTHDRPRDLAGCLEALAGTSASVEVIVVDSASPVPCEALVEHYRGRVPGLTYVFVPQPGLSRARNAGIESSRGEVVAFLDDDASPQEGWETALLDAFAARPGAGCVGGACIARFAGPRPRWLSDRLLQFASITRWGETPREPRSSAEWPFGANVAFRRTALRDAGPFAEELGRNGARSLLSGEDSDMVARVLAAGWQVWLEPRARVLHTVHPDRLTSAFYWRRFWWAGVSRAQAKSRRTAVRLLLAAPARLGIWIVTRDRLYLYRLAETAGYFSARIGVAGGSRRA